MSFDSYLDGPLSPSLRLRKWFFGALIVSVALHIALFAYFHFERLEEFKITQQERLAPRETKARVTEIDPKIFEREKPEPSTTEKVILSDTPSQLSTVPAEKPGDIPDNVTLSPQAPPENIKSLLKERPGLVDSKHSQVAPPQSNAAVERDLNQARQSLINKDAAPLISDAQMKLPSADRYGEPRSGTGQGGAPGFSNLDDLLAQSGPLTGSVAPVNMPGGALFAYDSAELHPSAIVTLQKLGQLIHRNPLATFSIEGHTDSFGDPAYNLQLSKARAESVKAWLVRHMGLPPERINTRGFGSSRLIAPATGTEQEQQINRRVEIVIRTPKQ